MFNCFSKISPALGPEESLTYALELLSPLYKVSEGFSGKVVSGMFIYLQYIEVAYVFMSCVNAFHCHRIDITA